VVSDLDGTLAALADPTRRRIVELLRERPRRAGELSAAFDISAPAVSRHLRILRHSGLIEERATGADARLRIYQLCHGRFATLRDWLGELEAFGEDPAEVFAERA
jgi:DNA-binding transcriptional ArsR family regulator